MEKLTRRQSDVLNYVKTYIVSHGYPPTVREIGKALEISSPATIHAHLANLEKKGFIKKEGSKNRAIELLVKNEFEPENELVAEVPLLGKITAGSPIEAIEMPDEYFALPSYLLPKGKEVFVKGFLRPNNYTKDGKSFTGFQVVVEKIRSANE